MANKGYKAYKRKSRSKSRKKYKKKRKTYATGKIITDGNSYDNRRVKANRKVKRKVHHSLKDKVAKLEKEFKRMVPSMSTHTQLFTEPYYYNATSECHKHVIQWHVHSKTKFDAAINSLRGSAVAIDQKTYVYGVKCNFVLQNNYNFPVYIRLRFFKAVDSTDDDVLALMRARIIDRRGGSAGIGAIQPEVPFASGTNSYVPPYFEISNSALMQNAIDIGGFSDYYRGIGKVQSFAISGGDSYRASFKVPDFTYNLEDYTDATETYLKGLDTFLVVEVVGGLGKTASITATSSMELLGLVTDQIKVAFNDGEGSRTISNTSNFDNTSVTNVIASFQPEPVRVTQ